MRKEFRKDKDYTFRGWIAVTAVIAVLVAVSFIPPQTLGSVRLRRANILSDLLTFNDAAAPAETADVIDEADFAIDLQQVAEQIEAQRIEADTAKHIPQVTFEWSLPHETVPRETVVPDSALLSPKLIEIEDFTCADSNSLKSFYDTLLYAKRPVRIAVLGDSFIEGDILTADLREELQNAFGGGGTGFAPMASPLTGFRRSVKTTSKGWQTYNIMQHKTTPAGLGENYFISGWVSRPSAGASTRWESSDFRQRLDNATAARIFFISPAASRIEVMLNDTLRREFAVEGAPSMRQIVVEAPAVHSLSFKVLSGTDGFIGYGAVFEADGVVVDNYSVRSNNGQAMFWTNPSVDAQFDALLPGYDLVILQYGLNIMQPGVHDYATYGRQIEKMVAFVRQCFPSAAILVLGVSDRSAKSDTGAYEPMDAVPFMSDAQRTAARNSAVAFWPVSEAMQALGGMEQFVANGWAGKDFTHINYAGGLHVARALFDALNAGARRVYTATEAAYIRRTNLPAVIDTQQLQTFGDVQLRPNSIPDTIIK